MRNQNQVAANAFAQQMQSMNCAVTGPDFSYHCV